MKFSINMRILTINKMNTKILSKLINNKKKTTKMEKKRRMNMKNQIMNKSNKKANFRNMKKSMMTERKFNFKMIK